MNTTDTERLDWLERNLLHLNHSRSISSAPMDGKHIVGQVLNEARGPQAGPRLLLIRAPSLRAFVDQAMAWKPEGSLP